MAITERQHPPDEATAGKTTKPRTAWWRRPWIVPLALITAIFLISALPPYLGLDPSEARAHIPPDNRTFYPVLVVHIFAGTVMLCCAVLQVWPWLRRRHQAVHRWSGRTYVVMTIPVGFGSLFIAQFPALGVVQQLGNSFLGVLLLITTFFGFRAARQRRFGDHREWMIRSFALAFSIVTNRFWGVFLVMVFAPSPQDPDFVAAAAISTWVSWVVNLLIAEWWLHRKPRRRVKSGGRGERGSSLLSA